jgi:hypothetical protein
MEDTIRSSSTIFLFLPVRGNLPRKVLRPYGSDAPRVRKFDQISFRAPIGLKMFQIGHFLALIDIRPTHTF